MKSKKTHKIIFWSATIFIFLFEGVMPALTSHTELAKEGIRSLGYPEYFGKALVFFKIAGSLILIIPQIPTRLKEWAYAGFTFDFLFAFISHVAVTGPEPLSFFPLAILAILMLPYVYFHKLRKGNYKEDVRVKANIPAI